MNRLLKKVKQKLKRIAKMGDTDYGAPWLHDFNPEIGFQIEKQRKHRKKRKRR